ncbi:MAG: pantoate--beta-alanine ligase [Candidatus Marinimicrobia bacterium]|nr:pantoate--beta-alanine ligase [Candidatus Neomarinimicrobiota bacterium]
MKVIREIDGVREFRRALSGTLGLVPTMGALHEGHLSLVRAALDECDTVLVSIYVNPTQFNAPSDFSSYPRDLDRDLELLTGAGVSAVFLPTDSTMYPDGFAAAVKVSGLADRWEGIHRPGHFDGVCTVVAKLFNLVQPDRAYFGMKDYQQFLVVKQLVLDLNMPLQIIAGPTLRTTDGLAYSSRNVLLSATERARAPQLKAALDEAAREINGGSPVKEATAGAVERLVGNAFNLDYLAHVDGHTLEELAQPAQDARLIVAARLGKIRLIDNIAV